MTTEMLAANTIDESAQGDTWAAVELDAAMARNPAARDAYLAMWGVEWSPLTSTATVERFERSITATVC